MARSPTMGHLKSSFLPVLHDELSEYKVQRRETAPDGFVFPSAAGARWRRATSKSRPAPLGSAGERAAGRDGALPLPEGLTPHKLRHTFASLLVATGVDPGRVMDQLRHADAGFTLRLSPRDAPRRHEPRAAGRPRQRGSVGRRRGDRHLRSRSAPAAPTAPSARGLHVDLHPIRKET